MAKHDFDDVCWSRYRARSLAETAHHMRLRVRKRADVDSTTDETAADSSEPPANEVK